MNNDQLEAIRNKTSDQKYLDYISDQGWKYQTEEQLFAGYTRLTKSKQGSLLTLDEFLQELQADAHIDTAQQLYSVLLGYVKKSALSAYGLYQYARFCWCIKHPEAVIACQTGPKRWEVNNCGESISEEQAILLLNSEWGFEAGRIKLLGTPYYEATDWNFICFRCGPCDWLMRDGELHRIYQ